MSRITGAETPWIPRKVNQFKTTTNHNKYRQMAIVSAAGQFYPSKIYIIIHYNQYTTICKVQSHRRREITT